MCLRSQQSHLILISSEQLQKDDNIRKDLSPEELEIEAPPSVEVIKYNVRKFLHPDREDPNDQKGPSTDEN